MFRFLTGKLKLQNFLNSLQFKNIPIRCFIFGCNDKIIYYFMADAERQKMQQNFQLKYTFIRSFWILNCDYYAGISYRLQFLQIMMYFVLYFRKLFQKLLENFPIVIFFFCTKWLQFRLTNIAAGLTSWYFIILKI